MPQILAPKIIARAAGGDALMAGAAP